MSRITGTNVPTDNVRAIFREAAEHVKAASTNNAVVSGAEVKDYLAQGQIADKRVRGLVRMLHAYAGHIDSDHLTRKDEVDAALDKKLNQLVNGRDVNQDGQLSNEESRALSKMGKIAYAIAKSRIDGPIDPGPARFGDALDKAIAAGVVQIETRGNNIIGVKVEENYNDGGLPGEPELLAAVLDLPQAKKIEKINVGYIEEWEETDTYEEAIKVIADRGPLPQLKNLFVGDFTQDQTEISWVDLGKTGALFKAAPNLEELTLRGADINLGRIAHDDLKSLTIETGGLPGNSMRAIGDAKLPQMEKLAVWFGDSEYGFSGQFTSMMNLLEGDNVPKLKELGLQNAEFTDAIMPMLVRANVVKQLETLDLSMGTMSDEGAQVLLNHAADLSHLKTINLDDNFISDSMKTKLQDAFGNRVQVGGQKEQYDEERRYVSVGE